MPRNCSHVQVVSVETQLSEHSLWASAPVPDGPLQRMVHGLCLMPLHHRACQCCCEAVVWAGHVWAGHVWAGHVLEPCRGEGLGTLMMN